MKQLIYIICCFCAVSSYAQETGEINATIILNEVFMLDLEPSVAPVTFIVSAPNEAGKMAVVKMGNNVKWINFSSAVAEKTHRSISLDLDGQLPSGIDLKLNIEKGLGFGELGSVPNADISLNSNNNPQTIINGIGGAYTGNGVGSGYKLTYSLVISDYESLGFDQSATLSITLTITDSI